MSDACRAWRGDLAVRALGRPDHEVSPGFDAHLDGCADCRAELAELRAAATAALRADIDRLHVPEPAPALADQIVARMTREAQDVAAARHTEDRRRRRTRAAVAGMAAAAAAAAAVVVVAIGIDGDDGRRWGRPIELAGPDGADGTAVLVDKAWGTEVDLEVSGLEEGEMYWLWLTDETGDRVVAGTFIGTEGDATAVLAAALPMEDCRRIWLTDEDDEVVLDAHVTPD